MSSCSEDEDTGELNPDVKFFFAKDNYKYGTEIEFSNLSKENGSTFESFMWDFGDGNTSEEENPTHSYSEAGEFKVKLTITDAEGNEYSDSEKITVLPDVSSWVPDVVTFYPKSWQNAELPVIVYFAVRNANFEVVDYTEDGKYTAAKLAEDTEDAPIGVSGISVPIEGDESLTFELYDPEGSDVADPDNDLLITSFTVKASDIVPEDEAGPYTYTYTDDEDDPTFELRMEWE